MKFSSCLRRRPESIRGQHPLVDFHNFLSLAFGILLTITWFCPLARGQMATPPSFNVPPQPQASVDPQAEAELQKGIALTRQSHFQEAIRHFLAAQGRVSDEYAVDFNLALCYFGVGQYQPAIRILEKLAKGRRGRAAVNNLLAQAYIGNRQPEEAFRTFQTAAKFEPKNEQLYLFISDACMDHHSYQLGLKVLDRGLAQLPKSARLHYERGIFYSFVNQPDLAAKDLQKVAKLAPGKVIAYLAAAQKALLDGDIPGTIREARQGIQKDPDNFFLLSILGQALIRNGVRPGQAEFTEAQNALQKSVAQRPDYWVSQLALGTLDQMAGHLDEAMAHLEAARRLSPSNPAAYSQLAIVYRKRGDMKNAEKMLRVLATLNQQQAAQYKLAEPGHMASYLGSPEPMK